MNDDLLHGTSLRILLHLSKKGNMETDTADNMTFSLSIEPSDFNDKTIRLRESGLITGTAQGLCILDQGRAKVAIVLKKEIEQFERTMYRTDDFRFALIEFVYNRGIVCRMEIPVHFVDFLPEEYKNRQLGSVAQVLEDNTKYVKVDGNLYSLTTFGKMYYENEGNSDLKSNFTGMVSKSQIITELLELVDSNPLNKVDFAPILEKHCAGLSFEEQRQVRGIIRGSLLELKQNEDIDYYDAEIHISVSVAQQWQGNGGLIRSTLKRKEKLERIERENRLHTIHYEDKSVKFEKGSSGTVLHGSTVSNSSIENSSSRSKSNPEPSKFVKFISHPVVKVILYLAGGLIIAYLIYRFGWN